MNGRCKCGKWGWLNKNELCPSCRPDPVKGPRTVKEVLTTLRRQAMKRKRKVTGEMELFKEMAKERPHICFVTGTPILRLTHWNFMHVLSKQAFPRFRLKKENVVLGQQWVHDVYDKGDRSKLEKYPGYQKLIELHDELKREYYQGR